MMAKHNPFIGRLIIMSVAEALGRRGAMVIEGHHARRDEFSVEAKPDQIGTGGGDHQPDAVDVFTAVERNGPQANGGQGSDANPEETGEKAGHYACTRARRG